MTSRKKKSHLDELDNIVEWIEDEVLSKDPVKISSKSGAKKKPKLYGENNLTVPKKAIANLDAYDIKVDETQVDKNVEAQTIGLVNRLTAQNISYISDQFEKLYALHSRAMINSVLFTNIESSLMSKHAVSKRRIVAEQMLLVAYLDSKITHDIGATLLHRLVTSFEELYSSQADEDKRMDNILLCLVNLYIIGLISVKIIYEFSKRICLQEFRPKSVELLLLIIKSVGFQLRKDDPSLTKQLIIMAQEKSKALNTNAEVGSRVEFMIEALGAIKNNNMSKLVNYGCDVDRDTIESVLKGLLKRTKLPEALSDATYKEILLSPNWYLLETRLEETSCPKHQDNNMPICTKTDQKICKALGLNKPAERTIFSALVRASDFVEASNVIIGYGLNYSSDAMFVCIQVAVHEKKYNEFHCNLINCLCHFNRRYKVAAKFSIQDKIRVLSHMGLKRVEIFKTLCLELIKKDAIPVTVLKAVDWADFDVCTKEFLVYLLDNISDKECTPVAAAMIRKVRSQIELSLMSN